MTINYKGLSYKLHEFVGDPIVKEQLRKNYEKFFFRSKPLDFFCKSLSFYQKEVQEYFEHLCANTLIFAIYKESEILFFIAFDFELKSLTVPQEYLKFVNSFNQNECCEFVFAASDSNSLMEMKFFVAQVFQYIKEKYNKKIVFGNINRKHKKEKYKKTIKRMFNFTILEDNFTFHEIP